MSKEQVEVGIVKLGKAKITVKTKLGKTVILAGERMLSRGMELKAQLEQIQDELTAIQTALKEQAADSVDLTNGSVVYKVRVRPGRKTLSKELLLENGVKAEVIQSSYKQGDPYFEGEWAEVSQ